MLDLFSAKAIDMIGPAHIPVIAATKLTMCKMLYVLCFSGMS